jgi:hypothetical protein
MTLISKKRKKKKERVDFAKSDPDYKPFIVMNEYLEVWTGLARGGRELIFSGDMDDAKPLCFDTQFNTLKRVTSLKLEQIYI